MKGFKTLLSKEWREQLKTFRLLIVSGIFLFFGLLTPVMLKYLPEIIKLAGEDLGGITIPPPTALQALTEYSATALQMGLLVAVLISMGAIAGERRSGTAAMTLSKPVSTGAFVTAKLLALSISFIIGLVIGGIGAYGYTWMLIGEGNLGGFIAQNGLMAVYLVFCITLTLIFSAVFKNSLAAGGVSIAVLLGTSGLGAVPWLGRVMPGSLNSWGNHLISGQGGGAEWLALGVTLAFIILGTYLAARILQGKEI